MEFHLRLKCEKEKKLCHATTQQKVKPKSVAKSEPNQTQIPQRLSSPVKLNKASMKAWAGFRANNARFIPLI